jgi:hypothetical protein
MRDLEICERARRQDARTPMNEDPLQPITAVFDAAPPADPDNKEAVPTPSPTPGTGWGQIPTPTSLPPAGRPVRAQLGCGARVAVAAALAMSLLALVVSSLLLVSVARVGSATGAILDDTINQLEGLCGPSSEPVVVPFSQTIHFQGDFALPEGLVIPFQGTIPINTVVRLTISALPGSPAVEIPIQTSVPVDTKVPVPGGIIIPIDTRIPINQDVALDLCGSGGPAKQFLERTIGNLKDLRGSLRFR